MKKLLFIFTLMLFPMLASAQTVSDVQNSGCTARARGAAGEGPVPTIMLTKEGNILSVEVLNYEANCCTDNFHVTSNINSGSDGSPSSLSISVVPVGALDCDCECPFNVSFTIRDLEPNSFYLKCWWYEGMVELTNGVPLVLEYKVEDVVIGEMSFRLLKVMHKAKLTKWTTEEKEIRIPSEVTYEGENYTVTSIDHDAFVDLDHLAKIAIPKSIRSTDLDVDGIIWANPFRECKSLEWIEVEEGCPLLSSDDGVLFAKNKTMLLGYPIASSRETYTVPESVTNIRSGSFYHNKYLRKLIIPEGVTYLGWHLFSDTKSLETLYIKGVLNPECIVDGLFGDMSTNVNIYVLPSEVDKFKAIYKGPVYPLPEQTVTIDGLLYKLNLGTHTAMVANTNNWEGELDIPEQVAYDGETYTVDRLEWLAFDFCKTLTKVRIPKTVVNIQHYAGYEDCKNPFRSCTSLESIEVDEANPSMCSIDGILFSKDRTQLYCYPAGAKRKTYSVPDGVTWIGGDAFAYNYSLTSIYMPNSVTYMSFGTFSNCKSLHSIRLSENIKHISAYTFEKCESLHFLDFPESVMYFAESVFRWSPIKTIVIRGTFPDGLRGDTFYFMDDEVVIYVQQSEIDKFKKVFKGTVLPLGDWIGNANRPFVEEGKVWKVGTISGNPVQVVDYYYFDGDTIIDGKTCKQMMCQRYVSPDHPDYAVITQYPLLTKVGTWYEENKKVYMYDKRKQTMTLKYDFSLEANDTLQFLNVDGSSPFIIGPKQTGEIEGFKGVYRDIMMCGNEGQHFHSTFWLEGVGGLYSPIINIYPGKVYPAVFLMSCTVGDEVIYLNDEYEDGATPEKSNAPKQRLDFTHIIKTRPQAPMMRTAEQPLYGEYNDQQLGINLDPLAEAYLVRITNESGKTVYEKAINAGNIVGLSIDISAYPKGRYTVTIENSREAFTGEFETDATGIVENVKIEKIKNASIYNLQGQRISTLQKGLNIVNGRKVLVK